jgi:transposase InsO family protein
VDQRRRFILLVDESDESFAQLCRRFGISRKTGYKWLERYELGGFDALCDVPRIAKEHPWTTSEEIAEAVIRVRREHPRWGPKKLRTLLQTEAPGEQWPAVSTIGKLLKQRGLVRPRRRRLQLSAHRGPLADAVGPNDIWGIDFKGHFATGDRRRCFPLTVTDLCSRYLLRCTSLTDQKGPGVRAQLELLFREFGLPKRMRSDNGPPFASHTLGGLSPLAVWLVKLGIVPERITPGHPEQNGRHERMHRTLKDETAAPPKSDLVAQQRAFDRFRAEYNDKRPHEALGFRTPASVYSSSTRAFPEHPKELDYPSGVETRRTDDHGAINLKGHRIQLAPAMVLVTVGLKPVDERRWQLLFGPLELGFIDATVGKPQLRSSLDNNPQASTGFSTPPPDPHPNNTTTATT